jgi:hypothetical protein
MLSLNNKYPGGIQTNGLFPVFMGCNTMPLHHTPLGTYVGIYSQSLNFYPKISFKCKQIVHSVEKIHFTSTRSDIFLVTALYPNEVFKIDFFIFTVWNETYWSSPINFSWTSSSDHHWKIKKGLKRTQFMVRQRFGIKDFFLFLPKDKWPNDFRSMFLLVSPERPVKSPTFKTKKMDESAKLENSICFSS